VTLWTFYEPVAPLDIAPAEYVHAVERMHAGMRQVDAPSPHFIDRVAEADRLLASPAATPDLADDDRALLRTALERMSNAVRRDGGDEQLLHGEPHLGNVLRTREGLRFVDLETCCRGPVEFDLAHGVLPNDERRTLTIDEVSTRAADADRTRIEQSHALIWAMITTWRWRHDDQLPNSRYWRVEGLRRLRLALDEL
jgi:Ser/Thr protein kinase RdoA (MazF antagonist)